MGTRHLIEVKDSKGNLKVSQYCQWDGYPTGAGSRIVDFLKKEGNIEKLDKALDKVRFFNQEEWEKLVNMHNEKDKDTIQYVNDFISRDLSVDVLDNIINTNIKEVLLQDSSDFKKDTLMCEWYYLIDLKYETLYIWNMPFDFDKLPNKQKLEKMENDEDI